MFNPDSPMEQVQCPIGLQMVRPSQIASAFDIKPAVLNYLQEKYPLWQPEQGVCINCVQVALEGLMQE